MEEDDLEKLQHLLERAEELYKFSTLFGGEIAIGEETMTTEQLKEMVVDFKSRIAVIISQKALSQNNKLKKIK